ncbi:MAG TPA: SLAP domain-containing protein [Desulfosporosinus sp.]|nr:SLAP domain-containing protein [Desulfosporosinus sp.]
MWDFTKFKGNKQDFELSEKAIVEANPLGQNEHNSEEQLDELLSVNEGQVTIHFTSAMAVDGALLVGFFVSNGLSHKLKFDDIPLVLMDSDRRVLARQTFDGETIGEIVGGSTKACVVNFLPSNVFVQDIPEACQVCFEVPAKPTQSVQIRYQEFPKNTDENQQLELGRILRELPPIKLGEINFSPLHAQLTSQNELLTTVIIRNSTDEKVRLEQMPIAVFDAQNAELARGLFTIEDLILEPFRAIVWAFNFGSIISDKDIDISTWNIKVIQ